MWIKRSVTVAICVTSWACAGDTTLETTGPATTLPSCRVVLGKDGGAVDFGKRLTGSKVRIPIVIANPGKDRVIIRSVQTSCGCSMAEVRDRVLGTGENTTLLLTIDGYARFGEFSSKVRIATDSPLFSNFLIGVRGEFYDAADRLMSTPHQLFLPDTPETGHVDQVFWIRRMGKQPLGELEVRPGLQCIDVAIDSKRSTSTDAFVRVKVNATGQIQSTVSVISGTEILEIPISVRRASMHVYPKAILVPTSGSAHVFDLLIHGDGVDQFETYTASVEGLEVEECALVTADKTKRDAVLRVTTGKYHKGYAHGTIFLKFVGNDGLLPIEVAGWRE